MDILWLEDFLAAVQHENFTRAAESRASSQAAFSRHILALESWVAVSLFDRSTHTVRLTPAGQRFRPAAEEILRRLQSAREEARSAASAARDILKVAATHAVSLTFFSSWLRSLEKRAPLAAPVQLTADHTAACEKMMIEGRAHFLLCHFHTAIASRLSSSAFRSLRVGQDRLLPVVAAGLSCSADVDELPHLGYSNESGIGRILAANGKVRDRPAVFVSHLATVIAMMAREGRGVAWSPLTLVQEDLEAGRLMRAGSPDDDLTVEIRLFRPRARQIPAAEQLWNMVSHHASAPI